MSEKDKDRQNWLRGDLPTWVAVGLITVMAWGGRAAYEHFTLTISKAVDQLQNHEVRITVIEREQRLPSK